MAYVRWNGINWDEGMAASWLATRLNRNAPDPTSDWHVMMTWDKSHRLKLMDKLKNVSPEDHKTIDRKFAEYARSNGLLDDAALRQREAGIKAGSHGYVDRPPQQTKPRVPAHRTFTVPARPVRASLLKRINDFRF